MFKVFLPGHLWFTELALRRREFTETSPQARLHNHAKPFGCIIKVKRPIMQREHLLLEVIESISCPYETTETYGEEAIGEAGIKFFCNPVVGCCRDVIWI